MTDLDNAAKILAKRLREKKKIRPELGDEADIRLLQDRAILATLSPGVKDLLYVAGQNLGRAYIEEGGRGSLREAIGLYANAAADHKLAKVQVVEVSEEKAVIRLLENANVYGLPNLGLRVCSFEAGGQSGFMSTFTGKRVVSSETKCCANGDEYCEFQIRVIAPEKIFAEAFKT